MCFVDVVGAAPPTCVVSDRHVSSQSHAPPPPHVLGVDSPSFSLTGGGDDARSHPTLDAGGNDSAGAAVTSTESQTASSTSTTTAFRTTRIAAPNKFRFGVLQVQEFQAMRVNGRVISCSVRTAFCAWPQVQLCTSLSSTHNLHVVQGTLRLRRTSCHRRRRCHCCRLGLGRLSIRWRGGR